MPVKQRETSSGNLSKKIRAEKSEEKIRAENSEDEDDEFDVESHQLSPNPAGMMAGVNGKSGSVSRTVRLAMTALNLPPIDVQDPEQLGERMTAYLKHCIENERKPQIAGLASWVGVSRDKISAWKNGTEGSAAQRELSQKVYTLMEDIWVDMMSSGKVNPPVGIFLSKNWFGYSDEQRITVVPESPYKIGAPDEVAQRYLEGMVGYEVVGDDGDVT